MRKSLVLPLIIIASVAIGGLFYLYGGPAFHQTLTTTAGGTNPAEPQGNGSFMVIGQGQQAPGIDERVNYRITNGDDLTALWQMLYAASGTSVPAVDFSQYEVLAVFDGSHSTGGYGVQVNSVADKDGKRIVDITHFEPGDSCQPAGQSTSPFVLVKVKRTDLVVDHVEHVVTRECR